MEASFLSSNEVVNSFVKDDLDLSSSKELWSVGFLNLPQELQLRIFSFFTHEELCKTVALVCKDWHRLSEDPSLWKSLSIFPRSEDEAKKLVRVLLRSPMLTKLKIKTKSSLEEFAASLYACPMLKHLELKMYSRVLQNRVLSLIVENCPLLEELDLGLSWNMDKECVDSIVRLTYLRVLNLSCRSFDNECIQLISEKCSHLEDLDLLNIHGMTNNTFCKLVENLNSTLVRLVINGEELTDEAFSRISLCTKLQHLLIDEGWRLTDQTASYLKMLTGFKSLELRGSRLLTDQTFSYLKMLTDLESLVLTESTLLTRSAINNFFAGPHACKLVHLELDEIDIDDDGMYIITQNCRFLERLLLSSCSVTEVGLEHIVKHCDNLSYFSLLYLDLTTGLSLLSIPEKLSRLKCLCLEYSTLKFVFEESVRVHLANQAPNLKIEFVEDEFANENLLPATTGYYQQIAQTARRVASIFKPLLDLF